MARVSPLTTMHEQAGAVVRSYGPPDAAVGVVEVYSGIGREYAAIRKSAAIFDWPQRTMVRVTGADRLAFLNRMVTQELKGFGDWQVRRSFWLNRKGRIDADLTLISAGGGAQQGTPGGGDRVMLDLDVHAAARTVAGLGAFVITDDVQIEDEADRTHRLAVHGPGAAAILGGHAEPLAGGAPVAELQRDSAGGYTIGGKPALVWRQDSTGEPGFELALAGPDAATVYELLAEKPDDFTRADRGFEPRGGRAVRAGWHAYNIARIEAGTPLYNLDFGPDSLPHETGVLHDRVSFKKGCYLGQEVVARMESLGHPKQRLVALRPGAAEPQAVTGTPVLASDAPDAAVVGAVTSSANSPVLGSAAICFAMVRYANSDPGARLALGFDPVRLPAVVQDSLTFWRRS